jgi:hypothetical protein
MTSRKSASSKTAGGKASKEEKDKQERAPIVAGISQTHVARPDKPFSTQVVIPPTAAPPSQQVLVKELKSGRVFPAWPVDARELVTHPNQEHVYASEDDAAAWVRPGTGAGGAMPSVPPKDTTAPTGVDPVPHSDLPAANAVSAESAKATLEDKSKSDLQDMAKRVGVNPDQPKADLVEALRPHAQAGTLALNPPASLRGPAPKESAKAGA